MNWKRFLVAGHEAGHAVAAVRVGWPFRYVSLSPRDPDVAGHVVSAPGAHRLLMSGRWEAELVVCAAGMVAEDLYGGGGDPAQRRRRIVRANSASTGDLRELQVLGRFVWHRAQDGAALDPPVDPSATVADIAGRVWRQTVLLVWEHRHAVCAVQGALCDSPRALTRTQVRQVIADADALVAAEADDEDGWPDEDPPAGEDLEFWPARYSRLAWRPMVRRTRGGEAA